MILNAKPTESVVERDHSKIVMLWLRLCFERVAASVRPAMPLPMMWTFRGIVVVWWKIGQIAVYDVLRRGVRSDGI